MQPAMLSRMSVLVSTLSQVSRPEGICGAGCPLCKSHRRDCSQMSQAKQIASLWRAKVLIDACEGPHADAQGDMTELGMGSH